MRKYLMEGSSVIPGCSTIHFDEISRKTIFSAIDKSTTPLKFLKEKYFNLRDRLGRMPTADEFYRHGEIDPILFIDYKKASYYRFVRAVDKGQYSMVSFFEDADDFRDLPNLCDL